MSLTRIITELIDVNTYIEITATSGNAEAVLVSNVIITDGSFANTEDIFVTESGGFIKLLGEGFTDGVNVYIGSTNVVAELVSNNEIRVTVPSLSQDSYDIFVYNRDGTNAIKLNGLLVSAAIQVTHAWFSGGSLAMNGYDYRGYRAMAGSTTPNAGPLLNTMSPVPVPAGYPSTPSSTNTTYVGTYTPKSQIAYDSPTTSTTIERYTFSNDTNLTDPRANLNGSRWHHAGAKSSTHGYWSGNDLRNPANVPGVTTPVPSQYWVSFGFGAPGTNSIVPTTIARAAATNVTRFTFNDDSAATTTRFNLATGRYGHSSFENPSFGWVTGGAISSSPTTTINEDTTTTERFDFSNDTDVTVSRGASGLARHFVSTTKNSAYAWIGGGTKVSAGSIGPTIAIYSRIDRVEFANDSNIALTRGDMIAAMFNTSGMSTPTFGYWTGGERNSIFNRTSEVFSSTAGPPAAPASDVFLYLTMPWATAMGNEHTFISRLSFSNDVVNAITRAQTNGASDGAGAENSTYGWFVGGIDVPYLSAPIYPFTESPNDESALSIPSTGPSSIIAQALDPNGAPWKASVFSIVSAGAWNPYLKSSMNRITFASDTVAATNRSSLFAGVRGVASVTGTI